MTDTTSTSPLSTVSRRGALALGLGAGAATLAAPAIVRAQAAKTWRMVMAWPKGTPGVGVNGERLAAMITEMSGGRLNVEVYGAGEMVPPFEVFDAVSGGTAELGHGTPYYWQGKNPVFHYFTGVPFGLTAQEHQGWLRFGGGQALWDEAYAPFGVLPFYAGSSGPQAGGWFRKPIESLDDMQGLKMRIAGLGGEVMRRIGVNTVLMPPGEIFPAMQSGTVDAAEWVGPWNDRAFGLYRVAKFYYMPAFHELGPALELLVNQKAMADLSPDLQAIVKAAALASSAEAFADFTYHNVVSLDPLLAEEGVELRKMPADVVGALAAASGEVLAEIAAKNDVATRVHESFLAYRAQADRYAQVADMEALSMRAMALKG